MGDSDFRPPGAPKPLNRLVEIRNISIRKTGFGINPHQSPWKNIFNVKYLENGERYDVGLKGGQIGTAHGLSIGTMIFYLS